MARALDGPAGPFSSDSDALCFFVDPEVQNLHQCRIATDRMAYTGHAVGIWVLRIIVSAEEAPVAIRTCDVEDRSPPLEDLDTNVGLEMRRDAVLRQTLGHGSIVTVAVSTVPLIPPREGARDRPG